MNLTEFLTEHNVEFKSLGEHHHATRGRVQVDCPFCSPKSGRFRMGLNNRYAACWTCGGHKLSEAIKLLTNCTSSELRQLLVDKDFVFDDSIYKKPLAVGNLKLPTEMVVSSLPPQHQKYLESRKFDYMEILRLWKIYGIKLHPTLPWRIFIPIILNGETVSWTTRSIGEPRAKYITAKLEEEKYHHKDLLYGEDYVRDTIIIVEGPLDVWRIGPGAVATFGINYTRAQVLRMTKYRNRYICFDPDPFADVKAEELCSELMMFPGMTAMIHLDDTDPADISDSDLVQLKKYLE